MTTLIAAVSIGALRVGGIEVDDHSVVCFDLWPRVPVFHRWGSWTTGTPQSEVDATSCGLGEFGEIERGEVGHD